MRVQLGKCSWESERVAESMRLAEKVGAVLETYEGLLDQKATRPAKVIGSADSRLAVEQPCLTSDCGLNLVSRSLKTATVRLCYTRKWVENFTAVLETKEAERGQVVRGYGHELLTRG